MGSPLIALEFPVRNNLPSLMNFSPAVKAWILLVCLVISSGGAVGYTAFLGGSAWPLALIAGVIASATNVYHALAESPKDKAEKAATVAPFPPSAK